MKVLKLNSKVMYDGAEYTVTHVESIELDGTVTYSVTGGPKKLLRYRIDDNAIGEAFQECTPLWYYKQDKDTGMITEEPMWGILIPKTDAYPDQRIIIFGPLFRVMCYVHELEQITKNERLYLLNPDMDKAKMIFDRYYRDQYAAFKEKADDYAIKLAKIWEPAA